MKNPVTAQDNDTFDQDDLQATMSKARRLYVQSVDPAAVAEVTQQLVRYLESFIPACTSIQERMPHGPAKRRLGQAVDVAQHLITKCPDSGPMSVVVHMQLLADSCLALNAYIRSPLIGSDGAQQQPGSER